MRALNDADLAIKIRDRQPKTLDDAFKWAQMYDSFRTANAESGSYDEVRKGRDGHARAVAASSADEARVAESKKAAAAEQRILAELKALRDDVKSSQVRQTQDQPVLAQNLPVYTTPLAPSWVPPQPAYPPPLNVPPQPLYSPPLSMTTPPAPPNSLQFSGTNTYGASAETTAPKSAVAYETPSREVRERLCFRCKQPGHWRKECPYQGKDGAGGGFDNRPQFHAKRVRKRRRGKWKTNRNAYYLEVVINGLKQVVIVDTGCDHTVVPPHVAVGRQLKPVEARLLAVGDREIPLRGKVALEVQLGGAKCTVDCLVSNRADEVFLGMDWLRSSQAEWKFGQRTITVGGNDFPLLSRADLGRPQPRGVAQLRTCRVVEPPAPTVVPLMSIVFERKFELPLWMEPPRHWERLSAAGGEEPCKASSAECRPSVETSGVAEIATKSVPATESTPSVAGLMRQPQEAKVEPGNVEASSVAESATKSAPATEPTPSVAIVAQQPVGAGVMPKGVVNERPVRAKFGSPVSGLEPRVWSSTLSTVTCNRRAQRW